MPPQWVFLVMGLGALIAGGGLLALVGWATCRARKLDDPEHPYLGNP